MRSDVTGVWAKLGHEVRLGAGLQPNSVLAFYLPCPCTFLTLQLPDVGVSLCRQSRSWEVSRLGSV